MFLDDPIDRIYARQGIARPCDITLDFWYPISHLHVSYRPGPTVAFFANATYFVFMDDQKPVCYRRWEIAHEIGHALLHRHRPDRIDPSERQRQEYEADHFALYALAPTSMLQRSLQRVWDQPYGGVIEELSAEFAMPDHAMARRLEIFDPIVFPVVLPEPATAGSGAWETRDAIDHDIAYGIVDGHAVCWRFRSASKGG